MEINRVRMRAFVDGKKEIRLFHVSTDPYTNLKAFLVSPFSLISLGWILAHELIKLIVIHILVLTLAYLEHLQR